MAHHDDGMASTVAEMFDRSISSDSSDTAEEFFDAPEDVLNSATNTLDHRQPNTSTTRNSNGLHGIITPNIQTLAGGLNIGEHHHDVGGQTSTTKPTTTSTSQTQQPSGTSNIALSIATPPLMVDSGIFSLQSSQIQDGVSNSPEATATSSPHTPLQRQTSCDNSPSASDSTVTKQEFEAPRPPPRQRKKKIRNDSADSRSMTNSVESTNTSVGKSIGHGIQLNSNLTSVLDDIVSIKGDLSITEVNDDKRSVYIDDHHLLSRQMNLKQSLLKQELIFSNEQLGKVAKDSTSPTSPSQQLQNISQSHSQLASPSSPDASANQPDNGTESDDRILSKSDSLPPNCLNPLSLHLMNLTNAYNEEVKKKTNSLEKSDGSLSNKTEATLKQMGNMITNTINDLKSDIKTLKDSTKDKDEKKKKKKNSEDEEEEDEEEEELKQLEPGKLRSGLQNIKKIGHGFMKGVRGIRRNGSTLAGDRSTFHVDPKLYNGEPDPAPPPPRYKLKINHKRGGADFENMKMIQEMNDCKGAIWCMKWSNCSQLLAAAGQDHLLRVYCAQKAWKYFTNLRTKASGQQHISPNSTKERGSSNGDSFDRRHKRSSFSRSGSLNTTDSHNNSSSSSSSSAFAMYRDEDTTLSEEGPMLLFTIYRGHTADVLDLAWSKNHFLLSASMDKTVRLWHITRIECLCTFRHIDFVTTIQFHPRDDRYFLSGSLDGKLRLWNIPDKRVTLWNEVNALPVRSSTGGANAGGGNSSAEGDTNPTHGLITASSFVQNGKFAVVGTYDGRIIFYTTDQLKYFTQIHVSNKTQSSNQATTKVTGLESIDDNNKILVTTNDSRLRLYDLRDLSLTCKYKGCINQSSQIKASVSHDHKFIICGSENNSFYIWRAVDNSAMGQRRDRNKQYEQIRLLNPPPASLPVLTPASSIDNSTSKDKSPDSATSPDGLSSKTVDADKKPEVDKSSTPTDPLPPLPPPPPAAQPHSSAATKIVTSANFAPVPGVIQEHAKYVIAIVDFNGYIRLFSKE